MLAKSLHLKAFPRWHSRFETASRKQLETVVSVANEVAELSIEVDDNGVRTTMPPGWPNTLVNRWQSIPPPTQPLPAGAEYPAGRLSK